MKIKKLLVALVLCCSTMAGTSLTALAWDPNTAITEDGYGRNEITIDDIEKYASGGATDENGDSSSVWTNADAKELANLVKKNNTGTSENCELITIDGKPYYLDQAGIQKCQYKMVGIVQDYALKSDIDGMAVDFNIKADLEGAGVALSGLEQVVSVLIGVICYGVVIGMTLFTALDLCYITMPVFRNKCEDMKQSGNSVMTKTGANGETKFRWVTDEAVYAVQTCAVDTGKSPLTVYLGKRVFAYILLAIVIYILFTGNIQLLANIAVNFVAGIMDALRTLGS